MHTDESMSFCSNSQTVRISPKPRSTLQARLVGGQLTRVGSECEDSCLNDQAWVLRAATMILKDEGFQIAKQSRLLNEQEE